MTTRPPAASSGGAPTHSPSLSAPPIRLRHPLPAPPAKSRSLRSPHPPPSSSTTLRTSPRYTSSPSTSPYYSSSHPSPAPSNSSGSGSASSSVRTPPDLLVNGASVGHTGKSGAGLVVNTWNGRAVKRRRWLDAEEIVKRKRLLEAIPAHGEEGWLKLPSPPPSPKRTVEAARRRSLTPTTTLTLAAAYRSAARALKHAADARSSHDHRPSYLASRPQPLAAHQQLDAVLLFAHAFYLDDLTAASTHAKNWISLFGLLRYATNAHSDLGNDVLLGVCRLVESAVLRKLHAHDARALDKAVDEAQWDEVRQMVKRQAADLERADRLWVQARSLLSVANLAVSHPDLLESALASTVPNTEPAARCVDPANESACTFAWPLDCLSPIPFLVSFGRRALAESARREALGFVLWDVRE